MQGIQTKFQVYEGIFDAKSNFNEENIYNQRLQEGISDLTQQMVYQLGDFGKSYPLTTMTSELAGRGASKEMDTIQYSYPVMGRVDKAVIISESCIAGSTINPSSQPGVGFSKVKIRFKDNWVKRGYTIRSARGVMIRLDTVDPVSIGSTFEYSGTLLSANSSEFVPDSELVAGAGWVSMWYNVSESGSRGSESQMVAPGKVKNQLGVIRASAQWEGAAAGKVMNIAIKNVQNGKTTKMWMDYFFYQFEKKWMDACENAYWYSVNNRLVTGEVSLKDTVTNKPVPTGAGILEQIFNKDTYGLTLTYSRLQDFISASLYGQSDTDNMSITLLTGKGGMRVINDALAAKGRELVPNYGDFNEKFIKGSGSDLMLGGFYTGFYHIDGYTVKVKYNPIFDYGAAALAQIVSGYVHPLYNNMPMESFRMVSIDDSTYDGQSNLQFVTLKGKPLLHGIVRGLNEVPDMINGGVESVANLNAPQIGSDYDGSSYHRIKSAGVQLLRGNKCFDMQCLL